MKRTIFTDPVGDEPSFFLQLISVPYLLFELGRGGARLLFENLIKMRLRAKACFKSNIKHTFFPCDDKLFCQIHPFGKNVFIGGQANAFLEYYVQMIGGKVYYGSKFF